MTKYNQEENEYRRQNDVLLGQLSGKFESFLERYESDQEQAKLFRIELLQDRDKDKARIKALEDIANNLKMPGKITFGTVTIIAGATLTFFIKSLLEWGKDHFGYHG